MALTFTEDDVDTMLAPPLKSGPMEFTDADVDQMLTPLKIKHTGPGVLTTPPGLGISGPALGSAVVQGAKDALTTLTSKPKWLAEIEKPFSATPAQILKRNAQQAELAANVSPVQDVAESALPGQATAEKILAGATQATGDLAESFQTPLGVATLGIGALPRAAQKVVAASFATWMASQTPEIARQLGDEFGKPADQRDAQKIARLAANAGLNTVFTVAGALHAAKTPKQEVTEAVAQQLREGTPAPGEMTPVAKVAGSLPVEETPDVTSAQIPPDLRKAGSVDITPLNVTQGRVATPQQPLQSFPNAKQPVAVPETPPEAQRGVNIIQEIRQRGANTIAAIQKLFPQANYTREQARVLRDQAFPPAERDQLENQKKGASYASNQPGPTGLPQPEVRPRVGEETSLRQSGQAAGTLPEPQGVQTQNVPARGEVAGAPQPQVAPAAHPTSIVHEDKPGLYGSRYIWAVIDGRPWKIRIADHDAGQSSAPGLPEVAKARKAQLAEAATIPNAEAFNVSWITDDPSKVSFDDVVKQIRKHVADEFYTHEDAKYGGTLWLKGDAENPEVEVEGDFYKKNTPQSEVNIGSSTPSGDIRMVQGEEIKPQTQQPVKPASATKTAGAPLPEVVKAGKALSGHIGATFDGEFPVPGPAPLLQFTWRAPDVPKDSPIYGASFYVAADASPEAALAKAKSKAADFGVTNYEPAQQTGRGTRPTKAVEPPAAKEPPMAEMADWFNVPVPDVTANRQRLKSLEELWKPLQDQYAKLKSEYDALGNEVLRTTGPSYMKGRVKTSAPKSKVARWQQLGKEMADINRQADTLRQSGRKDQDAVDAAVDASIVTDASQPLVRRLDRRVRMLGKQAPPEMVAALRAESARIVKEMVPDATPEEIQRLGPEVEREAYFGGEFKKQLALNPQFDIYAQRRSKLEAAVNNPHTPFPEFPEEFIQQLNRYTPFNRQYGDKSPVESLSHEQLTKLLKQVETQTAKVHADQQAAAAKRQEEEQARQAAEDQLFEEAQKVVDTAKRVGTVGGRSAKEVKTELIDRVRQAMDDLVADAKVKLEKREDGTYVAVGEDGTAALGEIEKEGDRFRVTARHAAHKENTINVTVQSLPEAEAIIKTMASNAPGKAVIGIPGDGVWRLARTGSSLLRVWSDARRLETASTVSGKPGSASAERPPTSPITTAAAWDEAKQYHGLEDDDKISTWSPTLKTFAEKVGAKIGVPTDEVTAKQVDDWIQTQNASKVQAFGGASNEGVFAFGGGKAKAGPTPSTPQGGAQVQRTMTPGLLGQTRQGILSLLLPSAKSPVHLTQAEILGSKIGAMDRRNEAANAQLHKHSRMFDKLGLDNPELTPANNAGIKFMGDMATGRPVDPKFARTAKLITKLFDDAVTKLEDLGKPIQTLRDNYFPGMWTAESRAAFNAAMQEAEASGTIPPNFDVNNATPQFRAAIKARVDELMERGQGSDRDMLAYLTRKPLKGRESFRKEKVFDDIQEAAEFGLRPVSNNPIDLVKLKLAELHRAIMAEEYFAELRDRGELKTISPYEQIPEGWQRLNDKYGTIYGPPTVKVAEHLDKNVYEGLVNFAKSIGVRHERTMRFPPGPGTRALGLSYTGQNFVRTKFGTETSVLAHEIGHQIDDRYGFWDRFIRDGPRSLYQGGKMTKEMETKARVRIKNELRNIADLTGGRGGHSREKAEQIAQTFEAYVHAPERMKAVAPVVYKLLDDFLASKPELAPLREIKPGIELLKNTADKYVGLPIMGYRIVPDAAADIVNNYLSSSLYNSKIPGLSQLYKGWMATANALNQSQLGLGSAFHLGFTTGDVQVSAGANVLKDVYGVLRGNRSLSDLAQTGKKFATATVGTAMQGDRVLNAWRNPDAPVPPKIAAIVKAAELAGGGFKLEHGMQTAQFDKMLRNWYSGQHLKAAARSPVAFTELLAKPIMDYLVPRQKAGVFAELAGRIIEQNPGKPLEDLRPQFRQAWNRVDARMGQVRYNRLFANRVAKEITQATVRAPGWSGGTIAELGGIFPDTAKFFQEWIKTGKLPANLPDRVAYTTSLLLLVGLTNAVLTYAFTGQAPHGMDFMAFRTGKKNKDGTEQRMMLPSYMKDVVAYAKHPGTTLLHKSHPALDVISDVVKNRDYYGYEIRDPDAPGYRQAGQVGKYVLQAFEPFWIRGSIQASQQGATPTSLLAPYFGVMPAPSYITLSPMREEINARYAERRGDPTKPYSAKATEGQKVKNYDPETADIYKFKHLPASDREALAAKMTDAERERYGVGQSVLSEWAW